MRSEGTADRLASPGDGAQRLSAGEIWALRGFWLDRIRRRQSARRPEPRLKNIFPDLGAVFVHIPKTAGTSVHELCSRVSPTPCPVEAAERARLGQVDRKGLTKHSKATEYVARMGTELWSSVYSFTFVRNPWDMMVSSYLWWLQKAPVYPHLRHLAAEAARLPDFAAFLRCRLGRDCINEFVGNPRDWFMSDGRDLVSHVGRFEAFSDDIGAILDRLGVERARRPELPKFNESRRRPYRDYHTPETRSLVAERFRYEIERFGYRF